MDVDIGELLAKATRSRSSMDALLFLGRALEASKNKPMFVLGGSGARGPSGGSGWSTAAGR